MQDQNAQPEDRHVRRSTEDYAQAFAALLPQGSAWPREPDSVLQRVILGLCQIWGANQQSTINVDGRAADLLERETDPRTTVELLPDWERAFGLPDLCLAEPLTVADRQKALTARVVILGGQSRKWFLDYAASIGYPIWIIEHAPYMTGISTVGDTTNWNNEGAIWYRWELGPEIMRFYWTIAPMHTRLTWFRTGGGGGEVGIDHLLEIAEATDLECVFQRYHPAHTEINFDYGGLHPFNKFSGTDSDLEQRVQVALEAPAPVILPTTRAIYTDQTGSAYTTEDGFTPYITE